MTPEELKRKASCLQQQVRDRLYWCEKNPTLAAERYGVERLGPAGQQRERTGCFLHRQLKGWCAKAARDICGPLGDPWTWEIFDLAGSSLPAFVITGHRDHGNANQS